MQWQHTQVKVDEVKQSVAELKSLAKSTCQFFGEGSSATALSGVFHVIRDFQRVRLRVWE